MSIASSTSSNKPRANDEGDMQKPPIGKEKVHIDIAGPDGLIVTYLVHVDVPMHKIFKKYCNYKQLEYLAMQFYHDGVRVLKRSTPAELHMKEGDQIDAFVYSGGA